MTKKILVVEDDPVQQQHICNVLSSTGAQIVLAANGRQGIASAQQEQPDLILMDIVMPEVDGFSACRQLSGDAATKGIPVVMVSSKNEEADRVWAQLQGAKAVVSKPFTDQELLDQVYALI